MKKKHNYALRIQVASQFPQKEQIFTQILQKILKQNLIAQIIKLKDHCRAKEKKTKKMIGLMKYELDKKVKTKSVGLEPNIFNYFKDNKDNGYYIKKAKITQKCGLKQKIKFKNNKNFVEAN